MWGYTIAQNLETTLSLGPSFESLSTYYMIIYFENLN